MGESGCGKSVTALSVMRLIPVPPGEIVGGRILFDGEDLVAVTERRMRQIRGGRIGMIFQEPMTSLNPVFTVGDQILEAVRLHLKLSASEGRERVIEMLDKVGIPSPRQRIDEYPHQMSGGMRQRVMIAMALSCNPKLLIADEPSTALDVTIQAQILDLIRALQEEFGMAVLMITHDLGVIAETAHRVVVMYASKIVEKAGATELFGSPVHPYTQGLFRSIPSIAGGQDPARDHRGHRAQPARVPGGLQVPHALRFRHGALRRARARPARGLRRPRRGLLASRSRRADVRSGQGGVNGNGELLRVEHLKKFFPIRRGVFSRVVGWVKAGGQRELPRRAAGRRSAWVGESGCGKTTVGRSILRLIEPTAGDV